jgi:hypothetical protein
MLDKIDWPVLARQAALVCVPLLVSWLGLPESLSLVISGPLVEVVSAVLIIVGGAVVLKVIAIGQAREQPKAKIEEVAKLSQVSKVEVKSEALADSIPNSKVVA